MFRKWPLMPCCAGCLSSHVLCKHTYTDIVNKQMNGCKSSPAKTALYCPLCMIRAQLLKYNIMIE